MKSCSTCQIEKSVDNFHKNRSRPDGLHNQCRACVSAGNRSWRERNPDKKAAQNRRTGNELRYDLKRYGISPDDYREMADRQGGVCAICGAACTERKRLSVDHCHETGRVRGLLCNQCNTALGLFRDSVERLEGAIRYLQG